MGRRRSGFTWLELLVVLVIIALLIAVLLPSLSHVHPTPRRTACLANLRAQGTAYQIYQAEYSGAGPVSAAKLGSLCEQTLEVRDAFVGTMTGTSSGASLATRQKIFYCPSNAAQDPSKLWTTGGVSTWGYVWLNDRGAAGAALPTTFPARVPALGYRTLDARGMLMGGNPALAELALDVIVSDKDSGTINYQPAGVSPVFGTNHMTGTGASAKPQLANVLFADGHAETRMFVEKKAVAIKQPGAGYLWVPG